MDGPSVPAPPAIGLGLATGPAGGLDAAGGGAAGAWEPIGAWEAIGAEGPGTADGDAAGMDPDIPLAGGADGAAGAGPAGAADLRPRRAFKSILGFAAAI